VIHIYQLDPRGIEQLDKRIWLIEDQDWADTSLQQWVRENCTLFDVRDVHIPGKNLLMRVHLCDPPAHRSGSSGDVTPASLNVGWVGRLFFPLSP
jgi:hypothetical protein